MGQNDVFELLKNKRLSGDDRYFSARQIMMVLKTYDMSFSINSVNNSLVKLWRFGYLEARLGKKLSKRKYAVLCNFYRLKKDYV